MSSQSAKSSSGHTFQSDLSATRNASDYIKQKKAKILFNQIRPNPLRLSFNQRQSYNLQLDYNLGSVVCNECPGGANYTKLRVGE